MKKPSKNLQSILASLLEQANAREGEPLQMRLSNNLRIDIRVLGGVVVLLISRSSIYPSDVEWRTVLRHWPYPVKCKSEKLERNHRHYLRGAWPSQDMLFGSDSSYHHPVKVTCSQDFS